VEKLKLAHSYVFRLVLYVAIALERRFAYEPRSDKIRTTNRPLDQVGN